MIDIVDVTPEYLEQAITDQLEKLGLTIVEKVELERLRAMNDIQIKDQAIAAHVDNYMKQEAEIERLQKAYASRGTEMDNMREVLATTQDWNTKATAEIERLRASNSALLAELMFVVGFCCDQLTNSTVARIRATIAKAERPE